LKTIKWSILQLVLFGVALWGIAWPAAADIEWENLQKFSLETQALDVTTSFDGDTVFMLTPGEIQIYSLEDGKVSGRIPVDPHFNRIAYAEGDRLVLSAGDPSTVAVIQYANVYPIDITGKPAKGPETAKVTLVVFDDYQ
jgi:hypothetical protein